MAIPITVPRLGWSMEEGNFVEWLKRDGDEVRVGEPLFVLESEKASEPVEAIDAGTLRITEESPKPGDVVKVGQVIGYFGEPPHRVPGLPGETVTITKTAKIAEQPTTSSFLPASRGPFEIHVTPRARRAARQLGLDPKTLTGSGRNGRVRERDVLAAKPVNGKLIPHTSIRKTIAVRMVAGVTVAAPVTLTTKVDAAFLVQTREATNAGYTELIAQQVAIALRQHPMLQAQWRDDGLWIPDHVNIAFAVDTEAGLMAPVIRDVDQLNLEQLVERSRELIEKARANKLTADDQRDATFTITNLGMFGIDAFTPIITLPQCAVLGVGRIANNSLTLSLTFDHRIIDGAPAARFLQTLARLLSQD